MNTIQRIAKNIGLSGISQGINYMLAFFLLVYLARYLGEEQFGELNFALSFTALFAIFAGLGIDNYIIREIARKKENAANFFINTLLIKTILSLFAFSLIILTVKVMNYTGEIINIIYLFGIYSILNSFIQTFRGLAQSLELMEYDAAITLISQILLFLLVLTVIHFGYQLLELAYVYIISALITIAISFLIVFNLFINREYKIDFSLWKIAIINSIPFGLNALFAILFFRINTVILSFFKDNAAIGIFSAAYNPLLAISLIPTIFIAAIYPVMSRYFIQSEDSLDKLAIYTVKLMSIIGFPIAIGCVVLADRFVGLLYADQYSGSVIVFQILALFIPIRFINNISGTLLTSINRQGLRTISVGLSALFNISLSLLIIPYQSYIGASITTVLSEGVMYMLFCHFIGKSYKDLMWHRYFLKSLAASLMMGVFAFCLKSINLFLLIFLLVLIYVTILKFIGLIGEEDINIIKRIKGTV